MSLPQSAKSQPSKFHKKRLSQEQVRLLEACFDATKKLEPERKFQLARELGVPPRQIAIWYQNKRARWKNQALEVDYGALQLRLEAALVEKKQLEREVDALRLELKRAEDMLFGSFREAAQLSQPNHAGPQVSSLSSCCDEGAASSSLNEDVGCSVKWGAAAAAGGETLQYEELYACLMLGGAKGSNGGQIPEGMNYERDFWV
ncbi:homeobox-leucine zipper protein ATHB-52-like [Andrographis paniculata]|uniref:homeobox-leucine zipper protein ATHB-52-like n=1 Tax=Andrographis paniculata TaxID=175694 RepID=UPI0021E931A1|nr:homeobox-leucine zipper protein ATHB-52-like [Andrographis paniculata]